MGEEKKLIRADAAQVLLLDKMVKQIEQLSMQVKETAEQTRTTAELIKAQVPEGVTEPIEPITVTNILKRVTPVKPWFNVSIVNDGPNSVKVLVNPEKSFEWHTIAKDETYRVDMGRPLINDILLQCEPNETASVRVVGSR